LKRKKKNVFIQEPITLNQTVQPVHHGGIRKPDTIYRNLLWNGFDIDTNQVILIDDVLTWGCHFKACQRMILEHHPEIEIVGIFWAKTIWDDSAN
jgi:hypoxanthine-guanine phosphoribosyltransferase